MLSESIDKKYHRFFGRNDAALKVITHALEDARIVRIATAYFEPSGYQCLKAALTGKEVRLLLGRSERGGDKVREVVDEFFDALAGGSFEEKTAAMRDLRAAIKNGLFLVGVSSVDDDVPATTMSPRYMYHHAKLYIADNSKAVVASSNFSAQGLRYSREAGITVTDPGDVNYFVERFDQYFEKAEPVAEELLARLEEWLEIYSPYDVYIRSLLELYGLPDEEEPGELPVLAGYQRPIVSRVLGNMEEYGGSMLVASTGLGKTIMAAHVVAYLHMQRKIDKAIVLCPAGLKRMWRRTMRAAHVSSVEYSYYILSLDDVNRYKDIDDLDRELWRAGGKTMIILDESHHLRNSLEGNELRLRHQRVMDAVRKETKILLMTATPYSRSVEDINSQLMLLPQKESDTDLFGHRRLVSWEINDPSEISEVPCSVVLTAPSVVKHFSTKDDKGEHYVVFGGDEKRYFPRKIHMRNVLYDNPFDELLIDLLRSGLLYARDDKDKELPLIEEGITGRRDALFEAKVVHQFCSSIKQIDSQLGKMEQSGGFDKIRFERQEELTAWVAGARIHTKPYLGIEEGICNDEKINKVVNILNSFPERKAVIFCYYRDTTRYVVDCLRSLMPGRNIEHTLDRSSEEIEEYIRRFAPISNTIDLGEGESEVSGDEQKPIDILVATTALSEGFNFQDASLLINFDLPWTVLILAQRMGRILRPWKEPREIYIYTLVPSTMGDDRIYHALNWKNRLLKRNEEMRSFSDIPVLVEKGSELEMVSLARAVKQFDDEVLNLDDVFEFIENADRLKTSSFIDDLAELDESQSKKYRRLPYGIKSYKKSRVNKQCLYLLFNHNHRMYPAITDENGAVMYNSNRKDEIMQIIRSTRDEEPWVLDFDTDSHDRWIEKSRNEWAAVNGFLPGEIKIVCYMMLIP